MSKISKNKIELFKKFIEELEEGLVNECKLEPPFNSEIYLDAYMRTVFIQDTQKYKYLDIMGIFIGEIAPSYWGIKYHGKEYLEKILKKEI